MAIGMKQAAMLISQMVIGIVASQRVAVDVEIVMELVGQTAAAIVMHV